MAAHTRQSVLAESIEHSKKLVERFNVGFDDSTHTKQTKDLPNHFAWCMGHLALTMQRVASAIDGKPISETDFILGSAPGDKNRFGHDSVSFGSKPTDNAAIYPTHARCAAVFDSAIARLADAVHSADDATLDKSIKWGAGEATIAALIPRMVYHNGVHAGQIIDLRRALGMKSVFS